jgi:hypothetical protein
MSIVHKSSEFDQQAIVLAWCDLNPPANQIFATPNGCPIGTLSPRKAVAMKKSGLKKGVADLFLPVPKKNRDGTIISCGLFIEMKKTRGGLLSPEQAAFLKQMQSNGYTAICAHGADEAIAEITKYLLDFY